MSRPAAHYLSGVFFDIWNADWLDRAACKGAPYEMFFSDDKGHDYSAALAVCGSCPVQPECLDHAVTNEEKFGVWGGIAPNKRKMLMPVVDLPKGRPPAALSHGTEHAYRLCTDGPGGGRCDRCLAGHAERGRRYKGQALR